MGRLDHTGDEAFASLGAVLSSYVVDGDGRCVPSASITLPENVQFAWPGRGATRLYVVCSDGGVASPGSRHWLVDVHIHRQGGYLTVEGLLPLPHRPLHVSLDEAGHQLLVSFNRPAALAVVSLDENGGFAAVQRLIQAPELVGVFPHQAIPVPGLGLVLLTCRGDDATKDHAERPGSLRLLDTGRDAARCTQVVAPGGGYGFGPRNCAFHPFRPWMYAVLERQNGLALFTRTGAGLLDEEPIYCVSTVAPSQSPGSPQLAGAISIHPSGRFLYVANRAHGLRPKGVHHVFAGGENSIAVFALDPRTGWPELIQSAPVVGLHPRAMDLNSSGTVLLAATRQGGLHAVEQGIVAEPASLCCFSVGPDGRLTLSGTTPMEPSEEHLFWCGFSGYREE